MKNQISTDCPFVRSRVRACLWSRISLMTWINKFLAAQRSSLFLFLSPFLSLPLSLLRLVSHLCAAHLISFCYTSDHNFSRCTFPLPSSRTHVSSGRVSENSPVINRLTSELSRHGTLAARRAAVDVIRCAHNLLHISLVSVLSVLAIAPYTI